MNDPSLATNVNESSDRRRISHDTKPQYTIKNDCLSAWRHRVRELESRSLGETISSSIFERFMIEKVWSTAYLKRVHLVREADHPQLSVNGGDSRLLRKIGCAMTT